MENIVERARRAAKAAGVAPVAFEDTQGCPVCVKAGLPLLLVRPGIAPQRYADRTANAIAPLLDGTTGDAPLKSGHGGYAARTLRADYVMVYYTNPTSPRVQDQNGWDAYRVDPNGYLMPQVLRDAPIGGAQASLRSDAAFRCNR